MSRALFLTSDFIAYIAIIFTTTTLRHLHLNYDLFLANIYAMLPFFPIFTLIFYIFSFYDFKRANSSERINYSNLLNTVLINVITAATILYFFAQPLGMVTPKTTLVAILVIYPAYIYVSRKLWFSSPLYKKRVIIFGESETIDEITELVKNSEVYTIADRQDVPDDKKEYDLQDIYCVLISSKLFQENPSSWPVIAAKFIKKGALLKTDFSAYEDLFFRTPKEGLEDAIWLLRGVGEREEKRLYTVIKKFFDTVIALIMLPVALPICAVIFLLILLIDKMPPFFRQERVGYMEAPVYIYKFRTMRPGTENITKLGEFLRRFRIDEFPQLINILKGDISFVGPRPLWKKDCEPLNKSIPSHGVRSIVKPGLTGWAQLNYKAPPNYFTIEKNEDFNDSKILNDAIMRFSYDIWYIKNRSLSLDFEIMFKTAKRMFIKDKNVANHNV